MANVAGTDVTGGDVTEPGGSLHPWDIAGLEVQYDLGPATWLQTRLAPREVREVCSWVPSGYESYARVFYPFRERENVMLSWSDVARRNGWVAHPEMTPEAIERSPSGRRSGIADLSPELQRLLAQNKLLENLGTAALRTDALWYLPEDQFATLTDVLRRHTTTPEGAWFCIWDGYGVGPDDGNPGEPPRLHLEWRDYLLYRGPLNGWQTYLSSELRTPDIWWPEDRAWVFATDTDFSWAYVGGRSALIEELVSSEQIEAMETEPGHNSGWRWADPVNDPEGSALDE
jgi:hypothetical protein